VYTPLESPSVTIPSSSDVFTANERTNITFTCNATGSPAPIISFLYEGMTQLNPLMNRVNLGDTLQYTNTLSGLYVVSRTFTLVDAIDEDSANYVCFAAADIPGTGIRNDSVRFQFTVFGKSVFNMIITK